ncbi:MAG: hypothetical protein U0350_13775 [Caldilineaceae bacterium]
MQRYRKRAYGVLLVLSLLALTVQASMIHAQTMFQGYTAGVQIANVLSTPASVLLTAYKPDGTSPWNLSDTISGNSSTSYFPVNNNSFVGSLVATTGNGNIVSIANLIAPGGIAGDSFIGQNTGATTVRLPLLMQNNSGFFTWFSVQNAGGNTANVTATYSDGTSASGSIAPNAAKNFFQSGESHNQKVFAAKITSNVNVVAAVVQENARMMLAYTGFTGSGSTTPAFPLINTNNNGIVTGIQLQNNGSSATNVTISYQPSNGSNNGTACTETQTIQPSASNSFALVAFSTSGNPTGVVSNCVKGALFVGSARVTTNSSSQPLTGVVNQVKSSFNQAGDYSGFDPNAATFKVVFPLIMDRHGGYYTGISVQNVGTAAASVNCTFSNTNYSIGATLQPGQALVDLQANKIANDYVGSGWCQASGTRLIGIVNEASSSTTLDQLLVYEGINVTQ